MIFWWKVTVEPVNSPFFYFFKPRKVGWSGWCRRDLREGGGNCLKYFERGWNRKDGRGQKDFKKGGKLGQGVGTLKKGGLKPPFELWVDVLYYHPQVFFNWDSLHARLNSHYKAWSHKKKIHKKIKPCRKSLQKEPTVNRFLLILDLNPFRS